MTAQEQEMIDGLISRIRSTEVQDKDTAAEQHLQQGLAGYPDSIYVLAQTVLVQQYGLGQAQAQIEDLKQRNAAMADQLQQAAHAAKSSGGSFLSHIFGSGSDQPAPPPRQNTSYQSVNSGSTGQPYPGTAYPPPSAYPPAGYPAQGGGGLFGGGGGGGFLQGALQTAAGVAAGEMVFQGMEGLFHGFDRGGERGFGAPGGGETVVNNYYDDDRGDRGGGDAGRDSGNFYNPSDDASRSDAGSDSQQFAGADNGGGSFSDSDDSSFDDSSSYDNSGDDSGGNF